MEQTKLDKKAEIDALEEMKAESNDEIQDQFSEQMFLFREQYQTEKQRLRQIFFSQFIVAILSILTIFYGIHGIVHFGFLFIGITLFGLALYESLELKIKLVQIIYLVLACLTFIVNFLIIFIKFQASHLLVSEKDKKKGYSLASGSFLAYLISFSIFKTTRKLTIKTNKKIQDDQENQNYIAFIQQNFKILNSVAISLIIFSLILGYIFSSDCFGSFGFMLLILLIYEIVTFMFDYILNLLDKVQFKCITTEDHKILLLISVLFVLYSLISWIFLEISEIFTEIYSKVVAGTIFGMGISFVTYFKWKIDIDKLKNK